MSGGSLTIRDAEVGGRAGQDVRLRAGRILEVGEGLSARGLELDAHGGALICGLADHHVHLLATAAEADSLRLADAADAAGLAERIRAWAARRPPGSWLRATGYHERTAGQLDRDDLDRLAPDHPLRVQDQSGGLWVLNGPALALVGAEQGPPCVERDAGGRPTGRIWRGDAWLGERIGRAFPPLARVGAALAAKGVTAVMDASASTGPAEAQRLAEAVRSGDLPLRLGLMSAGPLEAPADGAFSMGPVKVLLDERDLPPLGDFIGRIEAARGWGRPVAVHCVTAAELALTLAAFEAAGARSGDRIEHGGLVPAEAIPMIVRMALTVVTQPGFVFERGDRYRSEVDPAEHDDLYRCASLLEAGIPVAGSSDAPYSAADPWAAIRAAASRATRGGRALGLRERIAPRTALHLFLGDLARPGGPPRRATPGAAADLCLLKAPLATVLDSPSSELVAATLVDGQVIYEAR
ncbi:MAG: amidohydrolase family protein [Caulobacteraceae bacterium]|nr:amidohydrolase family protein [Caulobacteraceae bacterium]